MSGAGSLMAAGLAAMQAGVKRAAEP